MRRLNKYDYILFGTMVASHAGVALLVHLGTKKLVSEQYEERIDDEIRDSIAFLVKNEHLGSNVVISDQPDVDFPDEEIDKPIEGTRVFGEKPPLGDLAAKNMGTRYDRISTDEGYASDESLVVDEPYDDPEITVISKDLFEENVSGYEQETLTYFVGDGGVLDISGDFVEDSGTIIGEGVPHFGEMSEDAHIVYIRNKHIEKEYEVIRDPGKAASFINPENQLVDDSDIVNTEVSEELMHSLQAQYPPSYRRT